MTTPPTYLLGIALAASAAGLAGCAGVPAAPAPPAECLAVRGYALGCADVVEVAFADRPAWDCAASVGLDGRLPLADAGSPRVQGLTLAEAHLAVAAAARVEPSRLTLTLAEFRAARIYLTGPENGVRRTVPYVGPEPALDFLGRAGALKPGAAQAHDIRVVRPDLTSGGPPEVIPIDARGGSAVVLQASDEVIVAETFRSRLARLVPDWALPLYRKLAGLAPPDAWPAGD